MDKYTFGKQGAAVSVVDILERLDDGAKLKHRASRIISKYTTSMNALSHIPHKNTRETAYKYWRTLYLERVKSSEEFPIILKSHLQCVLVGTYRKLMRESRLGK